MNIGGGGRGAGSLSFEIYWLVRTVAAACSFWEWMPNMFFIRKQMGNTLIEVNTNLK